ncbi:MAG: hypothetical protein R3B84_14570 [Zavarzinella sp.]
MNKLAISAIVVAFLSLTGAAVTLYWVSNNDPIDQSETQAAAAQKDAFLELVGSLKTDEQQFLTEMQEIVESSSFPWSVSDAKLVLDATGKFPSREKLFAIDHVTAFTMSLPNQTEDPFHFVSAEDKRLIQLHVGGTWNRTRVLEVRNALAKIAPTFKVLASPPDWEVESRGGPRPQLAYLEWLESAHKEVSAGVRLTKLEQCSIPAFSTLDAQLLRHMAAVWNCPAAKKAFPPELFGNLYEGNRLVALPPSLKTYEALISQRVMNERQQLFGGEPSEEAISALNEIYGIRMGQFLETVAGFPHQ